jgi:acyl-CoA synthetase (NDP forming)
VAASLEVARAKLNDAGIPTYDYPDAAARAFALIVALQRPYPRML